MRARREISGRSGISSQLDSNGRDFQVIFRCRFALRAADRVGSQRPEVEICG
jgi:hypothetical protein